MWRVGCSNRDLGWILASGEMGGCYKSSAPSTFYSALAQVCPCLYRGHRRGDEARSSPACLRCPTGPYWALFSGSGSAIWESLPSPPKNFRILQQRESCGGESQEGSPHLCRRLGPLLPQLFSLEKTEYLMSWDILPRWKAAQLQGPLSKQDRAAHMVASLPRVSVKPDHGGGGFTWKITTLRAPPTSCCKLQPPFPTLLLQLLQVNSKPRQNTGSLTAR